MKQIRSPLDSNILIRLLHLHCFFQLFNPRAQQQNESFPPPRFTLFQPIIKHWKGASDRRKLFKNIILSFWRELAVGVGVTIVFASVNLLIPQIIKQFLQSLEDGGKTDRNTIWNFVGLQLMRMILQIHVKRLFGELAIKIQSTLSQKLVNKAMNMDSDCRKRLPQSEVYQLENVDLKIVYNLFSTLYLACQIPFTLGIAIIMLFAQNIKYGFIALYWFLVAFFVQRTLQDRMRQCNITKLNLIDKRSKLNYEFLEKITLARVSKSEALLVEKNNNYFIQENHDHKLFYRYASIHDITLVLLPIAVVVTIALYDYSDHAHPFTVQQVYVLLSLLGICYSPMKQFRTLSISFSDGLHSLKRISDYLDLPKAPKTSKNYLKSAVNKPGLVAVAKGTMGSIKNLDSQFHLTVKNQIEVNPKQRLIVLGRKGQGSSTFLQMLVGEVFVGIGAVKIQGRVAYLPQQNFFLSETVEDNIKFYRNYIHSETIRAIYKQLGLDQALKLTKGLEQIVEDNKFNENRLKLLSVARVLSSEADLFVLDNPYGGLNAQSAISVEKMLRKRQSQGKTIIIAIKKVEFADKDDKVVILNHGNTIQYGNFNILCQTPNSFIQNFLKAKIISTKEDMQEFNRIAKQFQTKVRRSLTFSSLFQNQKQLRQNRKKVNTLMQIISAYSLNLKRQADNIVACQKMMQQQEKVKEYFLKFITGIPLSQSAYCLFIIISAEILHIFIHFYIGHQYEHHSKKGLASLRTLMFYEVILTLGLAGLLFLEGEVSSHLAVATGSKIYSESIQSLVHKDLQWYGKHYFLRTADRFNHDYEQVFITYHGVLSVYKNVVILLATAIFVGGSHFIVILLTFGIALVYIAIWKMIRMSEIRIIKQYYEYKYQFVKVFSESVECASLFRIYEVNNEVIKKAQQKYIDLASYKLASNHLSYAKNLICDIVSTIITAVALSYAARPSLSNEKAVLATSVLLLLNLSDVLKATVDMAIQTETLFRINLLPLLQISNISSQKSFSNPGVAPSGFDIEFRNVLLQQNGESIFQNYPLKLKIKEGEKVVIYENDQVLRDNLLYGLTRNLTTLSNHDQRTIFIGGKKIADLSSQILYNLFGVIMQENFFLSGTLKEYLKWRTPNFDEEQALQFANLLGLDEDLKKFEKEGLNVQIQASNEQFNPQLGKKLIILKILIRKTPIVIIKDTPSFVGKWSIVDLMNKYNPGSTIIKITNTLEVAFDMERIVYLDHLRLKQDGDPKKLEHDRLSKIGELLRQCNTQGYLYLYRTSINQSNPHDKKKIKQSHKYLHV